MTTTRMISTRSTIGASLGLSLALLMTGCPKPPPPPPQPAPVQPPPPPPPVSLESLGQDMQADARVTFTQGLEVQADEEALGRAVVSLADAIAKGDADKLDKMLTAKAKPLLAELKATDQWSDATKKIESVRVVELRKDVTFLGLGDAARSANSMPGLSDLNSVMQNLPPETMAKVAQRLMASLGDLVKDAPKDPPSDPQQRADLVKQSVKNWLDRVLTAVRESGEVPEAQLEAVEKAFASPEFETKLEAIAAAAGAASTPAAGGSSIGVLIAIQDPKGAYLTGWQVLQVGDTYTFANAPSSPESRPRADAFDGIGLPGFLGTGSALAIADDKAKDNTNVGGDKPTDGGDSGSGSGGGQQDPGGGPGPKRTPSGPVTVPGGGGGGGGGGG